MTVETRPSEDDLLRRAVARLNAGVVGLVVGLLAGLGLAIATLVLVLKGGPNVGQHLGLLGHYFPGYAVTLPGAAVGLLWGFVAGFVAGWVLARVYNAIVALRRPS